MFHVHVTPFCPSATPKTGTPDAHILRWGNCGNEDKKFMGKQQSWDANQRKPDCSDMSCSPSLKNVLSSNPLTKPTRVAAFVPSSKKKEDAENHWDPPQGPPWVHQARILEEFQLQHPSKFPGILMGILTEGS